MARYMLDTDTATYIIRGKMACPGQSYRFCRKPGTLHLGSDPWGVALRHQAQGGSAPVVPSGPSISKADLVSSLESGCGQALCGRRGGAASSRDADRHHGHNDRRPCDRAGNRPRDQ